MEKNTVKKIGEGYPIGIEGDLYYFGVPRLPRAHLLIRGIDRCPAGVARHHPSYPFEITEYGLKTPKTSATQRSDRCALTCHGFHSSFGLF